MSVSRPVRWLFKIVVMLLVFAAGGLAWVWWQLNGSQAQLDGQMALPGLSQNVVIERDAQGIPTIRAQNRTDTAYALGVLHAQERFFQMDLLRRNSAGELSDLVGSAAINHDSGIRLHRFRWRAERAVSAMSEADQQLIRAYAEGVNNGLNKLSSPPFEYRLLRTEPAPWQTSDTILTLYSMYLDLQPQWNERERSLAVMRDLLPDDWYHFLTPAGGEWDAPLQGEAYRWDPFFPETPLAELQRSQQEVAWLYQDGIELGSNNWSVSGDLTPYNAAMVANDMHLGLRVPNIWYRASWFLEDDGRRVTGATLPGAPVMVVGSNEHIAWGFTNSNADVHDSIILQTNADRSEYRTPDGWQPFDRHIESVEVKDGEPVEIEVLETIWGPVIGEDHFGNLLAYRWIAHDVEGANLNLLLMEQADSVNDALVIAPIAGVPGQNLNVVDRDGNLAWSIMSPLPDRFGFQRLGISAALPSDWSEGNHGWQGYLDYDHHPRVVNPEHGRIWTANARIVSDELLNSVGWGDYALGARQQQIRDALFDRDRFTERDLLALQMDDTAIFLNRWQRLMLAVMDEETLRLHPELGPLRDYVQQWQGRASKTSVGYLAVKRYREHLIDQTVGGVYRHLSGASNAFWPNRVSRFVEYPVWALVQQQPEQHVPAGYDDWTDLLRRAAVDTLAVITADGEPLSDQTWGKANTLAIQHPLSAAVPFLSRWLNMPAEPMDGDTFMPLVQTPTNGASQRMVVAPGHEDNGIFHMATGQSGHPLSPYYSRGHRDWVEGRPSNFLPGPTQWRLELVAE